MAFDYQIPAVPKTKSEAPKPVPSAIKARVPQRRGIVPGDSKKSKIWGYLGIVIAALVIAVPLYFVVITSFKTHGDIYSNPISWIPNPWAPQNYSYVWNTMNFSRYMMNSIIICLVLVVIKVAFGVLSAYAFAFIKFPGSGLLFFLVIGTLMVPNEITIISNYALTAQLGWRDTFAGIIVPLAGTAFGTFLMRNHFRSLPKEIMEAATMDGAGFMRILFKVVLPMSWPTLMAFVMITAVAEWNQYLWPFLISDTGKVAPLQVGLTQLQDAEGLTNWGPVMAGTVLASIPMVIVFLLLQKSMIKGLTAGAVKG